jgi:hypothetical protein
MQLGIKDLFFDLLRHFGALHAVFGPAIIHCAERTGHNGPSRHGSQNRARNRVPVDGYTRSTLL